MNDPSPKKVPSSFAERLRQAIGEEPPHAWGLSVGIGKSTLDGLLNGGARPQMKTLQKIAERSNISINWLMAGREPKHINRKPVYGCSERTYALHATESNNEPGEAREEEFVLVPRYDGGVGPERSGCNEKVGHLAFRWDWIHQEMGLDTRQLALVTVRGDSMEPTLKDRDLLLLDRRDQTVSNDAVYVLRLADDLIAKRLQRGFDGSVTIKSDNPIYDKQVLPPDQVRRLQIIGRVIWTGRKM